MWRLFSFGSVVFLIKALEPVELNCNSSEKVIENCLLVVGSMAHHTTEWEKCQGSPAQLEERIPC